MLTQFQTKIPELSLMSNSWATQLNPVLAQPMSKGTILKNVTLISGTTTINHTLQRPLIGWQIIRQRASASVYDTQDSNQHPDLTLTLVSSALVVVDLFVF